MARTKLMLLYGGRSGEHEISLQSAASVLKHLNKKHYDVTPIGMDKQGRLYINNAEVLRKEHTQVLPVALPDAELLPSLIVDGKLAIDASVIFPMMHGPLCEDGALQGLFDLADVAYVGSDVLSSAICMDKDIARRCVDVEGVLPIRYHVLPYTTSAVEDQMRYEAAIDELGLPLFVKPAALGSSVGIHRVENLDALAAAVGDARRYGTTVLIEEFIAGREIELAVLEHEGLEGLPDVSVPGEIMFEHVDGFYSYAAKYVECDQTKLCIPAKIDDACTRKLQEAAAAIFTQLRCGGLARVDFFVQNNTGAIYFNEVNTLPGFTSMSMFPSLWEASGLIYPELLDRLIRQAELRQARRTTFVTDYMSVA
jgi:D-alanine-D-alanine ligase